jgi:hypothetical protein
VGADLTRASLFFLSAQCLSHPLTNGIGKFLAYGLYEFIGVFVGCVAQETDLLSITAAPFAQQKMNPKADAVEN